MTRQDTGEDTVELREYQRACLEAIKLRYKAGIRRQLICLPTGTGKTIIFAEFPSFFRMKKRMLVLAHREELLNQARDKILAANPRLKVGIEQANRKADAGADIVIASVPTLGRKHSSRVQRLNPDDFYLVVVDEAHHATATTYRRALEYFGVFEQKTDKLLVGFTATPKRGDGKGLDAVFDEITFSESLPEMVKAGYLSPLAAYRVETDVDLSGVKTRMGDFVTSQLSRAVNVQQRNELVVNVYEKRLAGRQTLCFCVDVAHAHSLAAAFERAGIPTTAVTGEMNRDDRARALSEFRSGGKRVLTNCMVLTEGYDESSISGIILARPTKSTLLYVQMIGRGTRLHPGKDNVVIVDVVDVTRGHELVSLSTLFGLPTNFDLEGRTTSQVRKAFEWAELNRPWVRTDLATSISNLKYRCLRVDLFDLETPEEIEWCSDYAWMKVGENRYRLNLARGEHIVLESTILGVWECNIWKGRTEQAVARGRSFESVIEEADTYVSKERKDSVKLVDSRSRWRRQPASEKQLTVLRTREIKLPKGLTKGQASHIIGLLPRGTAKAGSWEIG